MPKAQVNFLRRSRRALEKIQKRDRQFLLGGSALLVVSILGLAAGGGYWWYLQQQLAEVQANQKQAQAVVAQAGRQEAELLVYVTRLDMIQSVLTQRETKNQALAFLQSIAQPNMAFNSISYDGEAKILSFRAEAENLVTLENFLTRLRTPEIWEKLTDVKLSQISRDAKGVYSLEVQLQLKEDKAESRGV